MFKSISAIKDNIHLRSSITIDNGICKLHYRFTTIALLVAMILVCSREYVGEHIHCIADKGIPENVLKTYCFFMGTYTVPKHFNISNGFEVPHPGVGPLKEKDEITHHAYYQWVPFVLFLQALMFYTPHFIWRKLEDGQVKHYVGGLEYIVLSSLDNDFKFKKSPSDKDDTVILSKKNRDEKLQLIARVFIERLHSYRPWALYLVLCEILNFINVIGNIYFTNVFLGGVFLQYGPEVVEFFEKNPEDRSDPMDIVFPKITKCLFHKFGPSSTIQEHDVLCIMALNIINEKIYVFFWFWFVILSVLTGLGLLWRLMNFLLMCLSEGYRRLVLRRLCPVHLDPKDTDNIVNHCDFSDILFLSYVGSNMDGMVARRFFKCLNAELGSDSSDALLKKKLDDDDDDI